jgi:hypothetical protein
MITHLLIFPASDMLLSDLSIFLKLILQKALQFGVEEERLS